MYLRLKQIHNVETIFYFKRRRILDGGQITANASPSTIEKGTNPPKSDVGLGVSTTSLKTPSCPPGTTLEDSSNLSVDVGVDDGNDSDDKSDNFV